MKKINTLLILVPIFCTIFLISLFIYNINKGFNFSDEGFYLLSGAYPSDVKEQFTSFHDYLHLIMLISNNIIFLRCTTLILNVISVFLLSVLLLNLFDNESKNDKMVLIVLIFCSMLTVSALSFMFPQVPNYNTFTISGTLIIYSFIVLFLYTKNIKTSIFVQFLLGFFLAFVCLNKFSSGFILIILSILACITKYFCKRKLIFIAFIFLFLGLLSHMVLYFLVMQNPHLFWSSYKAGFFSMQILQSNHSLNLLRDYCQQILELLRFSYLRYHFVLGILIFLMVLNRMSIFSKLNGIKFIFNYVVVIIFFVLSYTVDESFGAARFLELCSFYFSAVFLIFLIWMIDFRLESIKKIDTHLTNKFLLLLLLFIIPIVVAFGTNNLIYMQILLSCFVWVPIFIFISYRIPSKNAKTFTFFGVAGICLLSLHYSAYSLKELPYGLYGNLADQVYLTNVNGTNLYLDSTSKMIIDETKVQLRKCGFQSNDYLVSLTDVPGLTYAVGGRSPSCPWYFGYYNGSDKFADFCLKLSPEVKSQFILLTHFVGQKNGFVESQLQNYFTDFPERYQKCGEIKQIPITGGVCCKAAIDNIKIYIAI